MYVSGAAIGMATIAALLRPILKDLLVALTALAVGVVGTSMPGSVVALSATTAALTPATAALGSAYVFRSDNSLF